MRTTAPIAHFIPNYFYHMRDALSNLFLVCCADKFIQINLFSSSTKKYDNTFVWCRIPVNTIHNSNSMQTHLFSWSKCCEQSHLRRMFHRLHIQDVHRE